MLRRTGPRPPLGELGTAGPAPPRQPRPETWRLTRLGRPVVASSSEFSSGGHAVRIEGVEGVERDRLCPGPDGAWPCGERALEAFAGLLGRGGLRCRLPRLAASSTVTTCRVGGQDVGAWLVSNGWALALPAGPYGKAEEVARKARMGIFGPPAPARGAAEGATPRGN